MIWCGTVLRQVSELLVKHVDLYKTKPFIYVQCWKVKYLAINIFTYFMYT